MRRFRGAKLEYLILLLAVGLILGGVGTVYAQEKEKAEFTLEEIIVTAERRETNAQDTPIAVTAWDSSTLNEMSIDGNLDLQMRMPSTTFTGNKIVIRGVGREMNQVGLDPGVAVYIDGVYNSEQYALTNTYDYERIEALRGPQGTLFGRNTPGGAINVIMKRPTKELEGNITVSAGMYDVQNFEAAVSGPIYKDILMARLVPRHYRWGGDRKNTWNNEYVGGGNSWTVSLRLLFEPSDRFEIYLATAASETNHNTGVNRNPDPYNTTGVKWTSPSSVIPNAAFWADPNKINPAVDSPWHTFRNPEDGGKNYTSSGGKSISTITTFDATDTLTIKHTQEHRTWDWTQSGAATRDPGPASTRMNGYINIPMHVYGWSEELQAIYSSPDSPISFVGGLAYYKMHEYQSYGISFSGTLDILSQPFYGAHYNWMLPLVGAGTPAALGGPLTMQNMADLSWIPSATGYADWTPIYFDGNPSVWYYKVWNDTVSQAAYGQIDYQLTDDWNVTLGGRYVEDTKDGWEFMEAYYQWPVSMSDLGMPMPGSGAAAPWYYAVPGPGDKYEFRYGPGQLSTFENYRKLSFTEWVGKLGVDWQPSESTIVFAKVSKGYKPGGYALGTGQDEPVDPETLWAYEGGWKQLWIEGRFNTNLSGYYYDYQDLQVARDLVDPTTGYSYSFTENAEGVEIWGIELESKGYIMENLLATLTLSYMQSEYTEFSSLDTSFKSRGVVDCSGNQVNRSPEWKGAVSLLYTMPTAKGDFTFYSIFYWQDETYYRPFGTDYDRGKAWSKTDARISWFSTDYKWRITANFDNIFNQPGTMDVTVDGEEPYQTRSHAIISPFSAGLEVSYTF